MIGANSQPLQPRTAPPTASDAMSATKSKPLSADSHPFVPASLPPQPTKINPKTSSLATTDTPGTSDLQHVNHVPATTLLSSINQSSSHDHTSTPEPMNLTDEASPVNDSIAEQSRTNRQFSSRSRNVSNDDPALDRIVYTHPISGYTFTKRQLSAYEHGVMEQVSNVDGTTSQVKVYFKPNFIDDNPWEALEVKAGMRKISGSV